MAEITATNAAIMIKRVAGCGKRLPTLSIESRIELKRFLAIMIRFLSN
jgi:hypothetical protein